MRLIDADALYQEFEKAAWYNNADRDEVAEQLVLDAPTIDAVPVAPLREMLFNLESKCCGDGAETYTTGYRNGHRNGQIELLRYILQVPDGTSEEERKDGDG